MPLELINSGMDILGDTIYGIYHNVEDPKLHVVFAYNVNSFEFKSDFYVTTYNYTHLHALDGR